MGTVTQIKDLDSSSFRSPPFTPFGLKYKETSEPFFVTREDVEEYYRLFY